MDMHETTEVMERKDRAVAPMRTNVGLMALLISLLVLVAGSAHADPNIANVYLQQTKNNYTLTNLYFQVGSNYAASRNAPLARSNFINAYSQSISMKFNALNLYSQNLSTLSAGQYRNATYQQLAVQHSNVLNQQTQLLSAYLNILANQPLNASARVSANAQLIQINSSLIYTEHYMRLAQL